MSARNGGADAPRSGEELSAPRKKGERDWVPTGERRRRLLAAVAERAVELEAGLRRAAQVAPARAAREETLAVADGFAAERRRLRALLAREEEAQPTGTSVGQPVLREPVEIGPLSIEPLTRRVTVAGEEVQLAAKEYALLRALASDPARVWTKEELLRDVWDAAHGYGRTRTVDSHASKLRRKLNGSPERRFVQNVWGIGYRLVDEYPGELR